MAVNLAVHLIHSELHGRYQAWCGHLSHSNYNTTTEEAANTCSKCSSRFYAEKIGTNFPYRLGDRFDLSQDAQRHRFKSIYPIVRCADEAKMGFIVIQNGWGKAWTVRPWQDSTTMVHVESNQDVPIPTMASTDVTYRHTPDAALLAGLFHSKEAALYQVPIMVEQGKLPSFDAVFAQAKENFALLRSNFEAKKRWQQQRDDADSKRRQIIQQEFAGMLAAGILTNAQRVAVTLAAEWLGVKL